MVKFQRSDLFPWVLSALLVAVAIPAGMAITKLATGSISSGGGGPITAAGTGPPDARPANPGLAGGTGTGYPVAGTSASATSAPASASPAGGVATPAALAMPAAATATFPSFPPGTPLESPATATPSRPPLPAGEVWQCEIHGEKIFSDAPCGPGATLRRLQDVNGMDAPPPSRTAYFAPSGSYPPPGYAPSSGNSPPPGYYPPSEDAYDGSSLPGNADGDEVGTSTVIGVNGRIISRGHPNHRHDPPPRPHPHDHRAPASVR